MSSFNRNTIVASFGNLPVKAAGQPVILPGTSDDIYNVLSGEIVAWNPKRNITLGVADIATEPHISIAVGVGPKGDLAKELIHIAGEQFNMCNAAFEVSVTKPQCPTPQIVDIFIDTVSLGEVYTLSLHLDDSRVRSEFGYNDKAQYTWSVPTKSLKCADCDEEAKVEELVCAMVDQINRTVQKDPRKITYFRKSDLSKIYQPFTATRLYVGDESSKTFCFEYDTTDTCENCVKFKPITGIKIDGTEYTFEHTVTADGNYTLPSMLNRILAETNRVLDVNDIGGLAILVDNPMKCCEPNIEINSCATTIQYMSGETLIDPCETSNPFSTEDLSTICHGCGVTPEQVNITNGIRIIVDPVDIPCDSPYPMNIPAPNLYTRTVEPQLAGDGWDCGNHYWKVHQTQQRPEGFGYFYVDRAFYMQHRGGSGRDWRYSNKPHGRLGLPDAGSRANNAINNIECNEVYCAYNIKSVGKEFSHFNNYSAYYNKDMTQFLVPSADTTTKTSLEAIINALAQRGICSAGNVECNPQE